jgi:hypothetical protein
MLVTVGSYFYGPLKERFMTTGSIADGDPHQRLLNVHAITGGEDKLMEEVAERGIADVTRELDSFKYMLFLSYDSTLSF